MDINELKQFAMAGDAEAMNNYGATFYNKGDYVPKNGIRRQRLPGVTGH